MSNDKSIYKGLAHSMAILGGTQLLQMLVVVARAKIVSVLLGPFGMGQYAIFQSLLVSIGQVCSIGINQSAIRNIAQCYKINDLKFSETTSVFNSLVWLSAFLGFIVCLLGCKWISVFSFGTDEYSLDIALLSIALFFMAFSTGSITIQQGCRELSLLSKTSLLGAIANLVIAVPLYWHYRSSGIVPSLILGYVFSFVLANYFNRKYLKVVITFPDIKKIKKGIPILKLGSVLMINSFLLTFNTFLLNIFINRIGNTSDVGYVQAAFNIINYSLMIVSSILASDFYPKIVPILSDKDALNRLINSQINLIIIIITPIIVGILAMTPLIIDILLSKNFYTIIGLLKLMSLALVFRCLWMVMSYVVLAQGNKKMYLLLDGILGNFIPLINNLIAYKWGGIIGVGISYAICSIVCGIAICFVIAKKYSVQIQLTKELIACIIVVFVVFLLSFWQEDSTVVNPALVMIFLGITVVGFIMLNSKIGLLDIIKQKFNI